MGFIDTFLPRLAEFGSLSYWIIFILAILEALPFIGLFVPGSFLGILLGFLSARGYMSLPLCIIFFAAGAIIGDAISYYLGLKGIKVFGKSGHKHMKKAESFFKNHGGKSILFGRFSGPLRPFIPVGAGMFKMDHKKFQFWNVVSAFAWILVYALLGYFFGNAFGIIERWSKRIGTVVTIVVVILAILYYFKTYLIKQGKLILSFLGDMASYIDKKIRKNEFIQKVVEHHPMIFNFLKRRFRRKEFMGLPLTLLFIAMVYTLFLFVGMVEDVITSDSIIIIDNQIANFLYYYRDVELVKIFLWITLLGKWEIVLFGLLITTLILVLFKKRKDIIGLLVAITGSMLFDVLGKLLIHRSRPEGIAVYQENSFSFPSGHATIAMAFYGFITYYIVRHMKIWQNKINFLFLGITIILAIGLSRLYLGVHFLSDVLGGYLLGLLWLLIGISISEWLNQKHSIFDWFKKKPIRSAKIITAVLIVFSIIFYVVFAIYYNPNFN
jgi:membrane protein DedA with SNARE-associated domain